MNASAAHSNEKRRRDVLNAGRSRAIEGWCASK
jgi:hypothetical protein